MRHREPAHLAAIMLRAVDHAARDEPVLEHAAVAVDVVQEEIERSDALLQSRFEACPFGRGDEPRQQIGRNDSLGRLIVAVDRERDALVQERLLARLLAQAQLLGRQLREAAVELRVMRPHASIGGEHFVVGAAEPIMRVGSLFAGLGLGAASGLERDYRSCESFLLHVRNENGSSGAAVKRLSDTSTLHARREEA